MQTDIKMESKMGYDITSYINHPDTHINNYDLFIWVFLPIIGIFIYKAVDIFLIYIFGHHATEIELKDKIEKENDSYKMEMNENEKTVYDIEKELDFLNENLDIFITHMVYCKDKIDKIVEENECKRSLETFGVNEERSRFFPFKVIAPEEAEKEQKDADKRREEKDKSEEIKIENEVLRQRIQTLEVAVNTLEIETNVFNKKCDEIDNHLIAFISEVNVLIDSQEHRDIGHHSSTMFDARNKMRQLMHRREAYKYREPTRVTDPHSYANPESTHYDSHKLYYKEHHPYSIIN